MDDDFEAKVDELYRKIMRPLPWHQKPIQKYNMFKSWLRYLYYKPWLSWCGRKFKYQLDVVPYPHLLETISSIEPWDCDDDWGQYERNATNAWVVVDIDELQTGYHAPTFYGPFDKREDAETYKKHISKWGSDLVYIYPVLAPTSDNSQWFEKLILNERGLLDLDD